MGPGLWQQVVGLAYCHGGGILPAIFWLEACNEYPVDILLTSSSSEGILNVLVEFLFSQDKFGGGNF